MRRRMKGALGLAVLVLMTPIAAFASDSATYTYDSLQRLSTVTYANGTTITYTYDSSVGNRSTVTVAGTADPLVKKAPEKAAVPTQGGTDAKK